ncbi:MAG: SMI1/KNR4 family protein [Verrucomicrobiota bacterium]|nr:SMI1/KNR4 family protein [Verrucomicrobiota bacterium]
MCELPVPPKEEDVRRLQEAFGGRLTDDHVSLLLEWGGAHLDEMRIAGAKEVRFADDRVVFADDYDGFIFQYDRHGAVFCEDTDGGKISRLADSLREFVDDVFLGPKSAEFYGEDWLDELRKYQIA